MSPSTVVKSYGAKSVRMVAEHAGMTERGLIWNFEHNRARFYDLCWSWAKATNPQLRKAFIDGCMHMGVSESMANDIADNEGFTK